VNSDPGRRAPPAFRADGAANGGHRSGEILRTRRAGTVVRDPLAPSHRAAARAGARLLAVRWTLATALAAIARSRRTPPRRGTNPGSGTPVPHPATVPRMPAHPPTLTSRHPSMPNVCSTTCRTSRCPSNDRSGVRAVTRTSAGRSWWGGSRAGAPSGTPGTAPTRACAERNCIVCNKPLRGTRSGWSGGIERLLDGLRSLLQRWTLPPAGSVRRLHRTGGDRSRSHVDSCAAGWDATHFARVTEICSWAT